MKLWNPSCRKWALEINAEKISPLFSVHTILFSQKVQHQTVSGNKVERHPENNIFKDIILLPWKIKILQYR